MTRPRIVDPTAIPVDGSDSHLPALPPSRLTAAALRERFARGDRPAAELAGDGATFGDREPAQASVLIALVDHGGPVNVLLTRRTEHLREHAGQLSFPGGRREGFDADAAAAALREAQEEVGLAPDRVDVIGELPTYTTVTRFVVTPIVAVVAPPLDLVLDTFEVAEAFEVPLAFLMDPANHRRHRFDFDGGQRQFLSMPWIGAGADGVVREYFIWGATAAMLRNLYRHLAA